MISQLFAGTEVITCIATLSLSDVIVKLQMSQVNQNVIFLIGQIKTLR